MIYDRSSISNGSPSTVILTKKELYSVGVLLTDYKTKKKGENSLDMITVYKPFLMAS
jgi:hypothetical protein